MTLLDCGTGELTTLAGILAGIGYSKAYAFDVSISRLLHGQSFVKKHLERYDELNIFAAEIEHIPLADNSIDVVLTAHALEPNHGREAVILDQIFRVARKFVILFEPCYEESSTPVKERMQRLGYVRGLDQYFAEKKLDVLEKFPMKVVHNELNPTWCWVIKAPSANNEYEITNPYRCPISGESLFYRKDLNVYWSKEGLYGYPCVGGIPILRKKHAIVMANP